MHLLAAGFPLRRRRHPSPASLLGVLWAPFHPLPAPRPRRPRPAPQAPPRSLALRPLPAPAAPGARSLAWGLRIPLPGPQHGALPRGPAVHQVPAARLQPALLGETRSREGRAGEGAGRCRGTRVPGELTAAASEPGSGGRQGVPIGGGEQKADKEGGEGWRGRERKETEQREKVRRGETTWALPFEEPLRLGFHLAADDSRCGVTSLSSPPEGSAPLQPPVHTPPSHFFLLPHYHKIQS